MGYWAAAKLFFSNLSPKGYLYIAIAIIVIALGSYGAYKYVDALSEASDAKSEIIALTEKVSEKNEKIRGLVNDNDMLNATVKSRDGTILLLRSQFELANELRGKSEKERLAAEKKYQDIYNKYKNEKDAPVSTKLAKILNDLEKED